MIQQLLPVHQDQRVGVSLGYEPACDHGLAEGRCGCEHAGVIRHQGIRGCLLFGSEGPKKPCPKRYATTPLVTQLGPNTVGHEEVESSIDTAPR